MLLCVFRSSSLSAVNSMLREQLEQAGLANEALSQDIRRLTVDWTRAREELDQKESDWRREEEVRGLNRFEKYYKYFCLYIFEINLKFSSWIPSTVL